MAPRTTVPERKNKRKVRTEVSSPSASESEPLPPPPSRKASDTPQNATTESHTFRDKDEESSDAEPVFTKRTVNPEQAFEDFYLRQATKEFANDLDKLRSASDFNARSVPLLIGALKQGTACFSPDERVRVGGAAESGD